MTFSLQTAKGTFFYDALVVPFDAESRLMIARDVTSHKQATLDLETSNRFFQKLAKTMPGVLFVYDLIEKRNLYVNHGRLGDAGLHRRRLSEDGRRVSRY